MTKELSYDHTPTPWAYDGTWALIKGPRGEEICAVHPGQGHDERPNRHVAWCNAELIVKAVNCHDDLLRALKLCNELLDDSDVRHYISHEQGEQARLHAALNAARKALKGSAE